MRFLARTLLLIFLIYGVKSFAQSGCTDHHATNFDPSAVTNDGSCVYAYTALPLTFKCNIDSLELYETSGIIKQDNHYWTHVDGGNNSIYRIDTLTDSIFQKVTLSNGGNVDWEDMSSDSNYIYVGDVGNNDGNRTNLRFYKILKSDITPSSTTVNAGRINFSYADQVDFTIHHNHHYHDCEAFFILNDTIHIFTKGWVNKWTKHYVLSADTGTHIAQLVDSFFVNGLITSAAIQGDSLIALLGLNFSGSYDCFVWMLSDFQGTQFFSGNKRRFTMGNPFSTGQTEAICFTDTKKGYITNEKIGSVPAKLREFNFNPYLEPPPPAPSAITTSVNSIVQNLRACADSGSATFIITNTTISGGNDLYFTINGFPAWAYPETFSDTLSPGDSTSITLDFLSGTMSGGIYVANILMQTNDPQHLNLNIPCTLFVDSNPCLDFTFTSDTCTGITNFTSTQINTPDYYHWDFGDGDTSDIQNPVHAYSTDGNYIATYIGCNADGCDTVVHNLQVITTGPKPASCYPVTQSYCCGIGITHFRLSGLSGDVINNISSDASVGFEDFSCSDTNYIMTNYSYSLTCTTANTIAEYLKVWLDMNNDGMIDSISEQIYSDLDTIAPVHSGIINIPALPGNVYGIPLRMRVASDFQQVPMPCLNPQSGQHEDYSIILNFSVGENVLTEKSFLNIYPNPFNHSATIDYTLVQPSNVSLEVFNLLGEKILTLIKTQKQSSGQYQFQFNDQPSGIYFVKLVVNEILYVEKIVKTF